ncbi:hypothetical protein AMTR_s00063p00105140 [Amborella trichopoda]|uniref:Uncharacterized protein n=1 Tax=Amborella trichopoda TaxID=13333 RepID=U5D488_AMBTC|nr:hypothetical protein AMTR_s00063p00105140 [Amborella trichopoda]
MAELVVPADTQSSDFSLAFNNVSFSDGILTFEIMAEPWTEESAPDKRNREEQQFCGEIQ